MKLWKLTITQKDFNAPLITTSYYYGTFNTVRAYLFSRDQIIMDKDGFARDNNTVWVVREVENFSYLGETPCESLQTNIMD